MVEAWWLPQVAKDLSQGDIVSALPLGSAFHPFAPVQKETGKQGSRVWIESNWNADNDGFGYFLARGRIVHALVISHSCKIDKSRRNQRLLLAPIATADRLDTNFRDQVFRGARYAFMPLPSVPTLGDCYADLGQISHVDRKFVDGCTRIASMSAEGLLRLESQLFAFFTRRKL
jgi:hypothetical protein